MYKNYRILFETIVGSTAYGTSIGTSDIDLAGIAIPGADALLGFEKFEQDDKFVDSNGEKVDRVIYSLDKAINLLLQNNPNIMDYLWMPDRCIQTTSPEWERYMEVRDEFISKKCYYRYQRYAQSQIDRLQVHQKYLAYEREPTEPQRVDFDLPEVSQFPRTSYDALTRIGSKYIDDDSVFEDFYEEFNTWFQSEGALIFKKHVPIKYHAFAIDDFKRDMRSYLGMMASLGDFYLKDEFKGVAVREMAYRSAVQDFKRYQKWKKGRNGNRQDLELKCGYDSKHASHALRLIKMGNEILEGKGVNVDRTHIDADELRYIRNANMSFDGFMDIVETERERSKIAIANHTLPDEPNRELINAITKDIMIKEIKGSH